MRDGTPKGSLELLGFLSFWPSVESDVLLGVRSLLIRTVDVLDRDTATYEQWNQTQITKRNVCEKMNDLPPRSLASCPCFVRLNINIGLMDCKCIL